MLVVLNADYKEYCATATSNGMEYILGLDAGATKTSSVITDKSGTVLGRGAAGPASLISSTEKDFKINVKKAIDAAIVSSGKDIKQFVAAGFGGAGIDTEKTYKEARKMLEPIIDLVDKDNLVIVNDTQLILPACSDSGYGVAVIAGTGSNFYGKNKEGEEAGAGGFDYLLSDEGSGYWVGLKVLHAIAKSEDGRGKKTVLEDIVKDHFSVYSIRDMMDIVYEESFKKRDVADLAILADKAYKDGDAVAESIFEDTVDEIALGINTVIGKLNMQDEDIDIVAVGGMFNSPYPLKDNIMKKITNKKAEFIICKKDLAEGAARLAIDLI
ncbi:MAG: BadF/BadG/BcrA/BcrD ATPase family protein [Candidatus Spechtbacterales bacterium]|nr:BadF/BadG/BcrA/BcrD ATPase family protein [Candidatus Spechtbacterales bacterium]